MRCGSVWYGSVRCSSVQHGSVRLGTAPQAAGVQGSAARGGAGRRVRARCKGAGCAARRAQGAQGAGRTQGARHAGCGGDAGRRAHKTVQRMQLHAGCRVQLGAGCMAQLHTGCRTQWGVGCRVRECRWGAWGRVQGAGPTAGCGVWSRAVGQPHHGAVWYGMIPATRKVCWGHLRGQARPRLKAQPQTRGMEATSSSGAIPHHDAQRAGKVAARTQGAPGSPWECSEPGGVPVGSVQPCIARRSRDPTSVRGWG